MYNLIVKSEAFNKIASEFNNQKLAHAILLIHNDKQYATAFAHGVAKLLVCPNNKIFNNCINCNICDNVNKSVHPDVYEYGKEKLINKDDVEELINNVNLRPYSADRKVYILYDYDEVNNTVENKLLKTIEEPPADVNFIILAKNEHRLLATTISRTQKYYLSGFNNKEIVNILKQNNIENAEIVSVLANNSLETAEKLTNSISSAKIADVAINMFTDLDSTTKLSSYISIFEQFGANLPVLLDYCGLLARDIIVAKSDKLNLITNKVFNDKIIQLANIFSFSALTKIIDQVLTSKKMLEFNSMQTNVIDQFLLKVVEVRLKCKK